MVAPSFKFRALRPPDCEMPLKEVILPDIWGRRGGEGRGGDGRGWEGWGGEGEGGTYSRIALRTVRENTKSREGAGEEWKRDLPPEAARSRVASVPAALSLPSLAASRLQGGNTDISKR